ncbi:MAG: hypothetical protein KDA27_12835 [Candidatus Eisenbacteria bacterium]|uniref:Uncharacterized protein n=1 Tax=Eiseniibacteriota bacterium TaxID=2212470 RepID=A0A956SDH9_UNCEI|nr:hypothetical protein [Candidatus Eisenbacteria bacterium]
MFKRVAILTMVGNTRYGRGPGHTAIAIDDKVYSFGDISICLGNDGVYSSGWIEMGVRDYIAQNSWRPVVVQELSASKVDARDVFRHIQRCADREDEHLGSGDGSSRAALAVEAGMAAPFDRAGIDTPYKLYQLAKYRGIVSQAYYYWGCTQRKGEGEFKLSVFYRETENPTPAICQWR